MEKMLIISDIDGILNDGSVHLNYDNRAYSKYVGPIAALHKRIKAREDIDCRLLFVTGSSRGYLSSKRLVSSYFGEDTSVLQATPEERWNKISEYIAEQGLEDFHSLYIDDLPMEVWKTLYGEDIPEFHGVIDKADGLSLFNTMAAVIQALEE